MTLYINTRNNERTDDRNKDIASDRSAHTQIHKDKCIHKYIQNT